jgi:hypothetical protein
MLGRALQHDIRQLERVEAQVGADTLRLWEAFRDQANLWRGIALVTLPVTIFALFASIIVYLTADTNIVVPQKRSPGIFRPSQLPDRHFIEFGKNLVNLIASYTPDTAQNQFTSAREQLWQPALAQFDTEMQGEELKTIMDTRRTQLFFIDPTRIKVIREPETEKVVVRIPGTRQKLIGKEPLPIDEAAFYVKMTTIPRNLENEYGIVAIDVRLRVTPLENLTKEDKEEERERERAAMGITTKRGGRSRPGR